MAINALQTASTGMSALSTNLDIIANNLANVNTDGYKASRANFQDLLYVEKAQPGTENANGDERPTGLYVGLGVKVSGTQLNFEQGAPQPTERPLDVMISGNGFFRVQIEDERGPNGIGYTRAGNFTRNADGDLVLANDEGRRLDPVINIPEDATNVQIMSTGEVFYKVDGDANPVPAGEIELAAFINPAGLEQIGENLYVETAGSGPELSGEPGLDGRGTLLPEHLEASNVNPTNELVDLIRTQRAFEMNSQVIRAADETWQNISQLGR